MGAEPVSTTGRLRLRAFVTMFNLEAATEYETSQVLARFKKKWK